MNVLYYMPKVTRANGGIWQYACALLNILAEDSQNNYFILHDAQDPIIRDIVDSSTHLTLIPPAIGREQLAQKYLRYARILSDQALVKATIRQHPLVLSHAERICNQYKIDVVYCPYQDTPSTTRRTIATLHDVQEIHMPELFTPAVRLERASIHKTITERSELIIVSYEHVKQDLITYFQRTPDNVLVCLLDMQNLWFEKFKSTHSDSLKPYKLPKSFILYPAVTWPHKNHLGLLKAVAWLRDERQITISAVFTGHQTEFINEIRETVRHLALEDQIQFLGVVSEEVLYALYQKARAVVVPTLYEAGSFPLMESILLGLPVICSNVTSLPDTIGDQQFVFDPSDPVEIADKVQKICFNDDYRRSNLENSNRQAVKLRNTDALNKLTKAIAELK